MEVAPGVHKFDTGPFNWYVVADGGRFTLVDAGFPGHYRALAAGLKPLGLTPGDCAGIVLTHAHADHVGFAERLRAETGVAVYVHPADAAAAGRSRQLPWYGLLSRAWRGYVFGMLAAATRNGIFFQPGVAKTVPLADGAELDLPGRPRAIHVPGHTPGEAVLYLPDRGVLLSGDAVVTLNLYTGRAGGPQFAPKPLNGDDGQSRRSLDKLRDLGRVTLLPGHGRPWVGDMAEAVELARAG